MIERFNGPSFLIIEEFDGSFLKKMFLIERDCGLRSYSGVSNKRTFAFIIF